MFTAEELEGLAVALRLACAAVPPNHDFRRWLPALLARVTTKQVRSRNDLTWPAISQNQSNGSTPGTRRHCSGRPHAKHRD